MFVIALVSYDEKNGFSGLFSSIEKLRELPTVSKEATTFLEKLSESTSISNRRFKRLAKDCDVTKDAVFQFAQGIRDGSIQLKDGQTMLQGYQSYLKSTGQAAQFADLKTKALSVSMKVLSTIGWMAAFTAATWVISKAAEGIDNWIHRVSIARDNIDEITSSIRDMNNEFKDTQKAIKDSAQRFAELSKGINSITGTNNNLSTDDYEEFLSISNQIAELFPTLPRIYDENGNAIVQLTGDVDGIVGSLNNLVKAQQSVVNQEIADKLPSLYKNIKVSDDGYKEELQKAENYIDQYRDYIDKLKSLNDFSDLAKLSESYYSQLGNVSRNATQAPFGHEYAAMANTLNGNGIASIDEAVAFYEDKLQSATKEVAKITNQQKSNWSQLITSITSWLYTNNTFSVMSDEVQSGILSTLNTIDWGKLGAENSEEVQRYIVKSLIDPLSDTENTELRDTFLKLFSLESGDFERIELAKQIQRQLNNLGIEFDIMPVVKDEEDIKRRLQNSLETISIGHTVSDTRDKISLNNSGDYKKLIDYTKDFNQAQSETWLNVVDYSKSAEENIKAFEHSLASSAQSALIFSDIFSLKDANKNATVLSELKDQLSEVESAYKTCLSAKEEYDEQGYLSVDTLEKVLSLGDEYLKYLFDEEGNVRLDVDAFQELAQARINNLEAQALSNLAENIKQITDEATATEYLAQKQNDLARSYADVAANALMAMSSIDGFSNSKPLQDAYNSFKSQYEQIKGLFANTRKSLPNTYSGKSTSKSSSDPLKDAFTQEYNTLKHNLEMEYITEKEYYDKLSELNNKYFAGKSAYLDEHRKYEEEVYKGLKSFYKDYVDKQIEFLDAQLDAGIINYTHYSSTVKSIIESMYRDAKISSADYHSYIENLLKKQLTIYQSALKGVTTLLDDEIDKWQKKIDAVNDSNDALEDQLDGYNGILSAVDDVYQTEIDNLNRQKEAIQDKINSLQDEADAYDLLKRKEDALYALEQARQQRTKKVFVEGKGYIYTQDTDAIKDAQENLNDIQNEEIIKQLEDEQSKLDDCIGVLEEYRKKWAEISSAKETETNKQLAVSLWGQEYDKLILQNRLKDIDDFKNNYLSIQYQIDDNTSLIESYNQKLEYYNSLKDQWTSISDVQENEMNRQYASQLLGANWESDVLTGRIDTLNQFKNQYVALQQAIADASWKSANEQIKAAKEAERASQGAMGSAGSVGQSGSVSMEKEEASQMWYVVDAKDQSLKISRGYPSQDEAISHLTDFAYRKNGVTIKKFHDGLKNGLVSSVKKDEDFSLVQKFGLKEYEVPTILKRGEGVLNSDQISNLAAALRYVPIQPNITKPDYSFLSNTCNNKGNSVSVKIGDINLHEVQKARDIAKEIQRELPNVMQQALHIR